MDVKLCYDLHKSTGSVWYTLPRGFFHMGKCPLSCCFTVWTKTVEIGVGFGKSKSKDASVYGIKAFLCLSMSTF